jgi:hypothetical protein
MVLIYNLIRSQGALEPPAYDREIGLLAAELRAWE